MKNCKKKIKRETEETVIKKKENSKEREKEKKKIKARDITLSDGIQYYLKQILIGSFFSHNTN